MFFLGTYREFSSEFAPWKCLLKVWFRYGLSFSSLIDVGKYGVESRSLDGRNRTRVIAESLARFLAAIRIRSVRWWSYLPLKTQNLVLVDPAFIALRFESRGLAFVGIVFVPRGLAEWLSRVDRVRWTLAIGDWRFRPSKSRSNQEILYSNLLRLQPLLFCLGPYFNPYFLGGSRTPLVPHLNFWGGFGAVVADGTEHNTQRAFGEGVPVSQRCSRVLLRIS